MELPTGPYKVKADRQRPCAYARRRDAGDRPLCPAAGQALPGDPHPHTLHRAGGGSLIAGLFAWQFATFGYHVLCQDVRGRFDSEGEYVPFLHEADDGRATLDWLAAQPWCDGNIGMWGASYLGYCQWAAAATGAPQLKALAPIITHSNLMHYPTNGFPMDLLLRWMFQMASMDDATLGFRDRMQRLNSGAVQDQFLGAAFDAPAPVDRRRGGHRARLRPLPGDGGCRPDPSPLDPCGPFRHGGAKPAGGLHGGVVRPLSGRDAERFQRTAGRGQSSRT